jgi:hypothetical protein
MTPVASSAEASESRDDPFASDSNPPKLQLGDPRGKLATNVRNCVTKGELRGLHFAEWVSGEKQPAESRC